MNIETRVKALWSSRPLWEKAYFWGFLVGFATATVMERTDRKRR